MGDLQATIEFSVELYKFFNVDLFQRGLYQVRCALKVSPRLPVQVETTIPETTSNGQPAAPPILNGNHLEVNHTTTSTSTPPTPPLPPPPPPSSSSTGNSMSNGHDFEWRNQQNQKQPQVQQQDQEQIDSSFINHQALLLSSTASIINGTGASRIFQILYRNEEISLRDVIYFRTHLLVDSRHIKESIERVEFSLQLELWFAEQNGSPNNLTLASTRTLQLNFHPCRGLHYHLPVLFDYFHLAAVSVAVHASLVALHQPYINAPKNFKPWISGGKLSCRGSMSPGPLEAVFFGPSVVNTTKCSGGPAVRLLQTRQLYRDVCGLLLKAIENLNMTLNEFSTVLPPNINTQIGSPPFCECDSNERLQKLLEQTKSYDSEEDFVQRANSDIAQLCAESIMLWRRVLVASTQPSVHTLLAKKHHILRVKRFSEGFFVMENSRHAAAGSYDNNYQNYIAIAEMVRRSRYLQCLPPLPIHCIPIDGDANALPLIFEDRYVEVNKISRMRTGSDSHLNCRENQIIVPKKNCAQTVIPVNGRKFNGNECSCGVTYEYKRNHCINDGLMSHYAMAREILQANLTLSPASAVEDFSDSLRLHQLPRHSLKCLIDESNGDVELCGGETDCSSGFCENGISRNFPATHSKSLDQLDDAVHNKSSTTYNKQTLNYSKTKLFDTDLRYSSQNSETAFVYTDNGTNRKLTVKAENLMRHISEFRHKYKNIEESFANSYQFYKDNGYNETRTAGGTLDRQISENGQKSSKFDYLHEIKLLNPPKQLMERHNSYYNSLPKSITNGQIVPKKPYLALNKSQTPQNGINPRAIVWPQKIAITRSNSSQALRSQLNHELRLNPISTIPRSVEIARVRVSDLKEMLKKGNFHKESSSSESDIPSKVKKAKSEQKMLSSNSVPYKLDITTTATINAQLIDAERNSNGFSESLPNLGRPPSLHHFINTTGNLSISTSSLSEESGWVSSRHSSMNPSSPDTLTNNEEKKLEPKEINPMDTLLNGEQLRIKLQTLLEQQTKAKRHKEHTINRRPSTLTSLETEPQRVTTITVKLKNERRITKSMAYNESTEVEDSDRIYNSTGKRERSYKKMEKSRSNIDLSCTKESQTITNVRVPPPQQFQDDLLPPDEFRDPPTGQDRQENAKKIINEDNKKKGLKSCNISPIKPIAAASNGNRTSSYQNTTTHSSPSLTVPPALPPPLKDILRLEKVSPKQPIRAIDNPVYHVYESIKPVPASCILNRTQVIRSHSILDMKRAKELTTSIQGHDPIRHLCNGHSNTPNELNNESFLSLQHNGTHVQDTNVMDGNKENSKTSKTNGHFKRFGSTKMKKRGSSSIAGGDGDGTSNDNNISNLEFEKYREEFRKQLKYSGSIYSDFNKLFSELPYFYISDEYRTFSPNGMHLIICVHGLDGNAADLRLVRTYLELGLPGANLEFLMSERNQGDTFSDFDIMTDRLVAEILFHIETCRLNPTRISFVAHSLGTIIVRSALSRPQMRSLLPRLHTFLSLSGPHLGTLYNTSGLVNMGMWFMQKWKKSGSLLQLCMRDASDMRNSFLYRLSQRSTLHHFKNILLCGSSQDRYVPAHSARLELCKAAIRDNTNMGVIYREMVHNIIAPILGRPELALIRYDVHHALPHTANTLIGRAAHIAVLDSELFIEKFLLISGLKYFS